MPYAVVDFETTGILPSYHHRVVEIGVTHVDDDGEVTGRWETLVNPERDLGPQRVHGVRAVEILDAPKFADIVADLAALLRDRTFVAHNAPFDVRFLRAEFERSGYLLPEEVPNLCTMRLGARFGLGSWCSLANACEIFGIKNAFAHSAGSDAFAAAQLLIAYMRASDTEIPGEWDWKDFWIREGRAGYGFPYPVLSSTGVVWKMRGEESAASPHFLERISATATHVDVVGADSEYLALLDRCLLDRLISVSEGDQLAEVAESLGLDRARVRDLHAAYFTALVSVAWADGVLTAEERTDLAAVAELLDVPARLREVDAGPGDGPAIAGGIPVGSFHLNAGDMVVLTGEMQRPRGEWETELRERGLVPHSAVTKKVALVVAADPDSLSGKARKARDYGIPIVSEDGLISMLEHAGR